MIDQCPGERNFHIFYQLLRGAEEKLLQQLHLVNSVDSYAYTNSDQNISDPTISDAEQFVTTNECLGGICRDGELLLNIYRLLAGILHLGNVLFDESTDADQICSTAEATKDSFKHAADLFGLKSDELLNCLTKQNMYVNGAVIVKVQTHTQVSLSNSFVIISCFDYFIFSIEFF